MKGITLLYDVSQTETVKESVIPLFAQHLRNATVFKPGFTAQLEEDAFIVTYLSDGQLKDFLPFAIDKHRKIGFLPHPDMLRARYTYGVSSELKDAVSNIISTDEVQDVDMMLANGLQVFDTLVIGETLSFMYSSQETSRLRKVWVRLGNFIRLFKKVRLKQYKIEFNVKEGKEKESINTAALGMLIVQHGRNSILSRRILTDSYANDGMMHSLVLAPESIMGLIHFGIVSFFRTGSRPKLPPFAAHLKTSRIKIQSDLPMDLSVDNIFLSAKEVEVEVVPKAMQIVPGINLKTRKKGTASKEIFITEPLPRGEQKNELLKGPLPLINHATTEQFKELFTALRDNSRPSSSYLMLMVLSSFIATLGLFSNSGPVIIGAMILAPLMSPIISLSMGVLRQDNGLIGNSLKSIGLGMVLGYLCAIVITWMMPLTSPNDQILARIRPNLLDLGIAVGSGIAGAYAHAKKEIAKTLAGVAIAVALVPPLAVSGIGLGWGSWTVFSGALLLLITNLGGIVLAAAITFLFLGFSPFRLAKRGLLISLIIVLGISMPLAYGFSRMVRETRITERLSGYQVGNIVLRDIEIRQVDPLQLSVKIIAEKPLTEAEIRKVKEEIEALVGEEVVLEVTIGIRM